MPEGNTIDTRQKWLEQHDVAHQLCRDLRAGVPAMREAALKEYRYLKPNPGELDPVEGQPGTFVTSQYSVNGRAWDRFMLRVERSDLPNPWADSISDTARLPFRARIVLDGWDAELMGPAEGEEGEPGWIADMDGEGRSLDEWAQENFEDSLFEGIVFAFVDNDPQAFDSVAQRRAAKARPWVTKLKTCDLYRLSWVTEGGRPRLVQAVFAQPRRVVDLSDPNNWVDEAQDAIKVVYAGDLTAEKGSDARKVRTQTWVKGEDDKEYRHERSLDAFITPDRPGDELTEIPLVPLVADRTGPYRGQSPYLNTAWTQAAIWVFNSEVAGLAREVTQSRWFESATDLEPGKTGGKDLLQDTQNARYRFSTAPGASLSLIESSGQPLKSIRELIADKTEQIRQAHHDLETTQPAQTTATEVRLQGVNANSSVEQWLILHTAGWKMTLDLMALLGGHTLRGTVEIPHDFGLPSQSMERNASLYMSDKMTAENYWREAQRAGDVDEREFDLQAELAREKESKVSAERARERLEKDMGDALRTPDNDDEPEREPAEVPQA